MRQLNIFILILFTGLIACKTKNISYPTAEVVLLSENKDGTITLKSAGYGKDFQDAVTDAQMNAFDILLFRGIPGSNRFKNPIIMDENMVKNQHKEYFDTFYSKAYFNTFMVNSVVSSNEIHLEKGKKVFVDVTINTNSLLRDLEQNNIIRKFGY